MRRNASRLFVLLAFATFLLSSHATADAGQLLSRILKGKQSGCRPVARIRWFGRCPAPTACPPPVYFCPEPGTTPLCPVELLMMVLDVDENGTSQCVLKVYLAKYCTNSNAVTICLPCTINAQTCQGGMCGENGMGGLGGPFIAVDEQIGPPPPPGGQPIVGNPGTEGVIVDPNPQGLAAGLQHVQAGFNRKVVAVQGTVEPERYTQFNDPSGATKYYELRRVSYMDNGVQRQMGVGLQIDALPTGATSLPGSVQAVAGQITRFDETDPANPTSIVWTYVLHNNQP